MQVLPVTAGAAVVAATPAMGLQVHAPAFFQLCQS